MAVLAGIAASDAICAAAIQQQYSGTDHAAAADLLQRVDPAMAKQLRDLIGLKAASRYGTSLLSATDRTRALRAARNLTDEASRRTL